MDKGMNEFLSTYHVPGSMSRAGQWSVLQETLGELWDQVGREIAKKGALNKDLWR